MKRAARRLLVHGVVQGVGFRPYVFRRATAAGLDGTVCNRGDAGVEIIIEGSPDAISRFVDRLPEDAPPLSSIERVIVEERAPSGLRGFRIVASHGGDSGTGTLPPDIAVCDACLADIADAGRYHDYWATTCTDCGPRFTVAERLPYDRPRTTMTAFPMCDACRREYTDPASRRYHAQTIACPRCGPALSFDGTPERAIDRCREALVGGLIVAIQGIGGTHLACDATNKETLLRLRRRLGRSSQPFAVMATDEIARQIAHIDPEEEKLLRSTRRPIVLLRKLPGTLPEEIAPGLPTVGVMLPYTGLQHLLFDGIDRPLVMTSANHPGRPMWIHHEEILSGVRGIAEGVLLHDREIANRCDDSVVRRSGGELRIIRRSRGYVPEALPVDLGNRSILALGGETDVAFALYEAGRIVPSQHIGSVDNPETLAFLKDAISRLQTLCGTRPPEIVACDLHPAFLTSRLAADLTAERPADRVCVQHHEAHFASVLAEHRRRDAVGVILDGYGYGRDGTAWGGEVFVACDGQIRRAGCLAPVALPGGDLATRNPLRLVASYLHAAGIAGRKIAEALVAHGMEEREIDVLLRQIDRGFNAPPTTSAGRFLDAVAALIGTCTVRTYEGEPAMRLEATAAGGQARELPIEIHERDGLLRLDGITAFARLYELLGVVTASDLAASAQAFLADGMVRLATRVARDAGVEAIAFSGGVAYNDAISGWLRDGVDAAGLELLTNQRVPCGDGGVAFGQAVLAAGNGAIPRYGQ